MSTWRQVYSGLQGAVASALSGVTPAAHVGIGYPPVTAFQNAGRTGGPPVVSIYDRGVAKDTTRWLPKQAVPETITAASITAALSNPYTAAGATFTLTFGNTAIANDAWGMTVRGGANGPITYVASAAETADAFATGVGSAISGAFSNLGVSVSGAVVTVTNNSGAGIAVTSAVGNVVSRMIEVHRTRREAQIIVASNTPDNRDALADPIDVLLGQYEVDFGYQLADDTWVRVWSQGDISLEDNIQHNVFRRDFIVSLEYGVTYLESGYSVLAPWLSSSFGTDVTT
jgi:hypothetical protein